jgi:hypothetical protein
MYIYSCIYMYTDILYVFMYVCMCVCVLYTHTHTHTYTHTHTHTSMHGGQDGAMVHMTPGVQLEAGTDNLGQRYLTPEIVITERTSGSFFLKNYFSLTTLASATSLQKWSSPSALRFLPPPPPFMQPDPAPWTFHTIILLYCRYNVWYFRN